MPRFVGGLVGYLGYDVIRFFEPMLAQPASADSRPASAQHLPEALYLLTDTLVAFDHARGRLLIIANAHLDGEIEAAYDAAVERIDRIAARLSAPVPARRAPELFVVERYSHVMHIVSQVESRLRDGLAAFDLLCATFPAGTVSGAPKVRAMEIIRELEQLARGLYAGAVGHFSYDGAMDTCLALRTLQRSGDLVSLQAGAGIVADSDPASEYQETLNKAQALALAIELAEK